MVGEQVSIEGDGPVRHLVLNRPDRHNAQTPVMWAELATVGRELAADPDVRCLVICGAGDTFSSGIDLNELRDPNGFIKRLAAHPNGDPDPMLGDIAVAQQAFQWMLRAPFLIIAAVTGVAFGVGFQLALASDVRIVASGARLALREASYGLIPDMGATASLPQLVGRERALDLMLSGKEITGEDAVTLGIALSAHPDADVVAAAEEYAAAIASMPRSGIAYAKAAVDEPSQERSLRQAARGQAACIRQASLPE
ncbi:Enoyl-CoA hydratase/carnithine racemase [Haloechinothrix alba]|uniref:Enoyl-CoA hydratase/carnithine racemase n=1 Tax=Haloechinothrix alba TaxID=664784 RepID=A0A238XNL4_9PSEU|nr:enoyl-CoA hydratase/isomerase family protein [Haloechinothrix alba]SNR60575.1 Enoyl-CoA hydratase/carnithine racemase [Haloechinothrix alba]